MADDIKPTIGGMLEASIAEQRAALQKLENQERARWWAALMEAWSLPPGEPGGGS